MSPRRMTREHYEELRDMEERGDMDDAGYAGDGTYFRDPGGRSALRAGARRYKCPSCNRPRMLTKADRDRGYQCDRCADQAEQGGC